MSNSIQFYKIDLITMTTGKGSQAGMLQKLEKGLFVQLEEKEYQDITKQMELWKNSMG